MGSHGNNKYDKVALVPWDPENEAQFQRMYDQRVACGWRKEEVPEWKGMMLKGTLLLYWIVLAKDLPGREEMLATHVERAENEREELVDTAKTVSKTPRTPTGAKFLPVGHCALQDMPERDEKYGFPKTSFWIRSLYVSWSLHSRGLGRSAMAQMEQVARAPPLNGTLIALDTIPGDFQRSEDSLKTMYDERGLPRPQEVRTNQDWYLRQGYELFRVEEQGHEWENPRTGEVIVLPIVYLKKSLV